jgi:hypothetical protein
VSETVCIVRCTSFDALVGGCRFDGGAVLVRHVSRRAKVTARNSLARSRVRRRSFIIKQIQHSLSNYIQYF